MSQIAPVRLIRIPEPFDHPDFLYEPKIATDAHGASELTVQTVAHLDDGHLSDERLRELP
jgi:hypothetical protein